MRITLQLFGALREFHSGGELLLDCPQARTVDDVRSGLDRHAREHWSGYRPQLLQSCAFASEQEILHRGSALPANGRMAVLPPVSGG